MTRTSISMPQELKVWLDDYSKSNNKPTAETIREAIKAFKKRLKKNRRLIYFQKLPVYGRRKTLMD